MISCVKQVAMTSFQNHCLCYSCGGLYMYKHLKLWACITTETRNVDIITGAKHELWKHA